MTVAERSVARERLAFAAREAGLDPERLLELFDRNAAQASRAPEVQTVAAKPLDQSGAPAILAAICDTFTYEELAAATQPRAPEGDIAPLLSRAAPVMLGGQRRLRLFPEARREILAASRESGLFRSLLVESQSRAVPEASDAAQRQNYWVREFLAGTAAPIERLSLQELVSAAAALDALEGVPLGSNAPTAVEARRLLEWARLVEPLKILVGAREAPADDPSADRFVGRKAELTLLRAHVDELDSKSIVEGVQRTFTRINQRARALIGARSPGPLVIEARGGLGKSTLIAKFVLDHATGGSQRFGFAYLDFDRAGLQAQPAQLLAEVARQTALQFPAIAAPLADIRLALNAGGGADALEVQFNEFRRLVQQQSGGRSFLLVLDTMEVVQYNPEWLEGVSGFAKALHGGEFPELRIVAAGRADIPELQEENEFWAKGTLESLNPLGVRDAREMVSRLGQDLMPGAWNDAWARKIAGQAAQPENRREPLSLRVAVELMRSIDDPADRERFADEIAEAGDAHDSFVGKLYQRRILDHVRDPEVRKLAWPGLVLRTITADLIASILAGPCELDPGRIPEVFDALGREVWIVRREGDSLRHRPDLRARTLPLMRRKDPDKFNRINQAAIAHFARDPSPEGRAEWLYHRLLDGEAPDSVDRDWDDDLALRLAGAADDFVTDLPDAAAYLQARTSRRLLAAAQLARLPERLAFEHVARTARRLTQLDDRRANGTVLDLALRAGQVSNGSLPPEAEAARQAILIKTGQWQAEAIQYAREDDPRSAYYDYNWSFYTARAALPGGKSLWRSIAIQNRRVEPFVLFAQPQHVRARIQDLARLRAEQNPLWRDLDRAIASVISRPFPGASEPSDIAAWRLCAIVGEESRPAALRNWAQSSLRRSSVISPPVLAETELAALAGCGRWPMFADLVGPSLRSLDFNPENLRERAEAALDPRESIRSLRPRVESAELARAVNHFVTLLSDSPDPVDIRALRTFAAVRSEDWIVPLGYTLLRRHGRALPPPDVLKLLQLDDGSGWFHRIAGRRPPLTDPLVILRRADEGGQISAVLDLYRHSSSENAADEDLQNLAELHLRWRNLLTECAVQ
jgi:hypothetical protein